MKPTPLLKTPNVLPICFLSLAVTQILLFLLGVKLALDYQQIKANMNRTLVQEADGTTFVAETYTGSHRPPGAIKAFVRDWLKAQYSFSGQTFDGEGKVIKDRGVNVDSVRVPLSAYSASFAIPTQLRNDFLKVLVREWLPKNYFESNHTIVEFLILEMSEPKLKNSKDKIWEVAVIAELNYQTPSNEFFTQDFERSVLLKPINIPPAKLTKISPFSERLAYQWRSRGLKVVGLDALD